MSMREGYMATVEALIASGKLGGAERAAAICAEPAITEYEELPELPPEIIEGVIRKGGKLLVAGASKAGKSYLLIELAVAVSTGGWWLGRFKCMKGRVLYVNLEIQRPQFMHRVCRVADALHADQTLVNENLMIANLRGKYSDAATLVDDLISTYKCGEFDLVIIDPAYKIQPGSENDADAITRFCAELDRLVEALDCTVAYSHHHSKGGQGGKNAQDRASGSGVFGRDADALIDMVELGINDDAYMAERLRGRRGAIPFRLEFVLRDFKSPEPLDIWFTHPIHVTDDTGTLASCNVRKPGKAHCSGKDRSEATRAEIEAALEEFMGTRKEVDRKTFVSHVGKDKRTVNKHLEDSELFELVSGPSSAVIRRKC
ncbi:MAG: hypothetical protein E7Z99_10405 [Coriobacteriaceae bacterium]|nr:hypothetical protein [Coriobacteriaceae bacterium]